jgi:hypothetical protein
MTNTADRVGRIILWVIWAWMMLALPFYKIYLGKGDRGEKHEDPIFVMGMLIIPLVISTSLRWLLIRKMNNPFLILIPFIFGISVAESLVFYGKFLFPEHESLFFWAGALAMAQFIPLYGKKAEGRPPPLPTPPSM